MSYNMNDFPYLSRRCTLLLEIHLFRAEVEFNILNDGSVVDFFVDLNETLLSRSAIIQFFFYFSPLKFK